MYTGRITIYVSEYFFLALKSYLVMILDRLIDFLVIKKRKFDFLEKPITVNFVNQKQAM